MRLSALLEALGPEHATRIASGADMDPVVRGLAYDSRAVTPGDVFFALRGADVDGHDYLRQALERGAVAAVVEAIPAGTEARCPLVVVRDARRALAPVATCFFGSPARELRLVGVTGTNGKTSTTYLLESILGRAGQRVGLIGTVEVRFAGERRRAVNTTPESLDLQRTLRDMHTRGVETAVIEVSSHGLELGRVDGCQFAAAAFTNLTQDHLDFHGHMAAYRDSKLLLFSDHLVAGGAAIVNVDDPSAGAFVEVARSNGARLVRVSRDATKDAEVRLIEARIALDGTRARVALPGGALELDSPLVGDFNVENLLVACATATALDIAPEAIAAGIAGCPQVPGRAQVVARDHGTPTVIVDYAHTPDAVDKLLATVRPLCDGRLVAVFGCGGDRDRAKRPLMAEAVARHADRVIATSDNPRTEDPEQILDDVVGGLSGLRRVDPDELDLAQDAYVRVTDRRAAIDAAVSIARSEDTVVIAGKGHEDYQIIGRERLPFSDVDEARRALAAREAV